MRLYDELLKRLALPRHSLLGLIGYQGPLLKALESVSSVGPVATTQQHSYWQGHKALDHNNRKTHPGSRGRE